MKDFASQSQDLLLEATGSTPYIKYSKGQRKLTLKGKATASNARELIEPVVSMLKKDTIASRSVSVDICLSDANMNTMKVLFDLFKYLNLKKLTGGDVEVIWRAASTHPEMIDTGLNFSDLYDLDVQMITI
ncbi:SiaC family regulatory phosphoprotein [Marinoscillum sp.]|uniref:SiaC family regulatory phosphoprotein n=1 Tax=Marinoscillum sp. TaxID=2024838 RepID=UPI003BA935D3